MLPPPLFKRLATDVRQFYDAFLARFQACPYHYDECLSDDEQYLEITFPVTEPIVKHIQILVFNRGASNSGQSAERSQDNTEFDAPIKILVSVGKHGMHTHYDGLAQILLADFKTRIQHLPPTPRPTVPELTASLIQQSLDNVEALLTDGVYVVTEHPDEHGEWHVYSDGTLSGQTISLEEPAIETSSRERVMKYRIQGIHAQ